MPSESVSTPEIAIAEPGKGEQVGASGPPTESSTSPPPKKFAGIIYLITREFADLPLKHYVGQSRQSLEERWRGHLSAARSGANTPLHKAIRKYGTGAFSIAIIEEVEKPENLNAREIYWGMRFSSLAPVGYNLMLGNSVADEELLTERKRRATAAVRTPEVRAKRSELARARSPQTSIEMKQKWTTETYRSTQVASSKRLAKLPERRTSLLRNLAKANVLNKTPEAREKMSQGQRRSWSDPKNVHRHEQASRVFAATWAREGFRQVHRASLNAPGVQERRIATLRASGRFEQITAKRAAGVRAFWANATPEQRAERGRRSQEGRRRKTRFP